MAGGRQGMTPPGNALDRGLAGPPPDPCPWARETGHSRVAVNRGHPGVSRRVEPSLGVGGLLSGWDQRRLEVLEEMKVRFDYGDERLAFSKLDFMSQQDLKRRFPGHFDDDPPRPWP